MNETPELLPQSSRWVPGNPGSSNNCLLPGPAAFGGCGAPFLPFVDYNPSQLENLHSNPFYSVLKLCRHALLFLLLGFFIFISQVLLFFCHIYSPRAYFTSILASGTPACLSRYPLYLLYCFAKVTILLI